MADSTAKPTQGSSTCTGISPELLAYIGVGHMEIDDMNTMDVDTDTDYEPTDSAMPGASVGEPCHKHSFGDNNSVVDKSPVSIFDPHNDATNVRPSIIGPREHPEALKTHGFRRVHIDETQNTYRTVIAYKDVYRRSLTQFVLGKNNHVSLLDATDDFVTGCPKTNIRERKARQLNAKRWSASAKKRHLIIEALGDRDSSSSRSPPGSRHHLSESHKT